MKGITIHSSIEELNKYLVYNYIRYNVDKQNTSRKRLEFVISILNKRKHEGESLLFENGYGWLNHNIFDADIDVDSTELLAVMINNNINVDVLYVEYETFRFKNIEDVRSCTRNNKQGETKVDDTVEDIEEEVKNLNKESNMKKAFKYTAIVVLAVAAGVAGKFAYDKYKN